MGRLQPFEWHLSVMPGTRSWLLSGKPDEWMHLSPFYTRMNGEWLRYAKYTSQYSLAFSLNVRDDWGFQVKPLCRHDITDRELKTLSIRERWLRT